METPTAALTVVNPTELFRQATDVAGLCKEIAISTASEIDGKQYVRVEGWMAIATAHGCVASARDVEKIEGGVRAIAEIKKISDGAVICSAEGFVGEDEPVWFGGTGKARNGGVKTYEKRPDYAIRAMAQTRAISRACRTAFAHVVVLMKANLQTTPAEEVPLDGFGDRHTAPPATAGGAAGEGGGAQREVSVPRDPEVGAKLKEGEKWEDVVIHFGNRRGTKLGDLEDRDVAWYADKWTIKPNPRTNKIEPADLRLKAAVEAWAADRARGAR